MKNKKLIVFIFVFFNCSLISFGNQPGSINKKIEKCGTVGHTEILKSKNPSLEQQIVHDEKALQLILNNSSNSRLTNTVYTIPVVVHVVYFTSAQNISVAQIQSQIDVLNDDFGRKNADTTKTPHSFSSYASATNFQFCLASRDPNDISTNGIERRQTNIQVFNQGDDMKFYARGGLNAWDVSKYLNVWVCDMGGQIIGYGEQPTSTPSNTFGVVIQYNTFGKTGVVIPPYQLGRTCTHEISHCFDLYHIWGDEDSCSGTDYINDTPNQAEATFGCHSFPYADICTITFPGIMFMNYMDYSDDNCMNMFTKDQAARMIASMNFYYPSILTSNGCLAVGIDQLKDFKFNLYPNPTSGLLDIDMFTAKDIGSKVNISISDIFGKVIYETVILNPNQFVHQVDLHQFSNGIYFATIFNSNFKKTEKIILNH